MGPYLPPRPQSPVNFCSITQKMYATKAKTNNEINTSSPPVTSFLDLPAATQENVLAIELLRSTTLTLTSARARAGKKRRTIPGTRTWGPEMLAMHTVLNISPKLLDNAISMIASRTTVKTYGNNFHKAMSAVPVEFWASVEHLHLQTTYPVSVDGLFISFPRLRTVEVGLEWLTMGSNHVEVVTTEDFDWVTDDESPARIKARIDEVVVAKTRAILAHNENECVRRAMQAHDGSFKLLITATFVRKGLHDEHSLPTLIMDRVSEKSPSRLSNR